MSNLELYQHAFMETFEISEKQLPGIHYKGILNWDSVGHIRLITLLEDNFNIVIDPDDIIDFVSYEKGMEILTEKYDVKFL